MRSIFGEIVKGAVARLVATKLREIVLLFRLNNNQELFVKLDIAEFGVASPDVEYVLRPGGYSVIFSATGEVAIVMTPDGLALPGGGQEGAESPEEAAVREAREECGLVIALGNRIGVADEMVFSEGHYYRKRCTFFIAESLESVEASEPDHELIWTSPERAISELRRESQRWAVAEACRLTAL
jgi:8-oxo-dGTP diphosphatase